MERWQRIDEAAAAEAADELRICCASEAWIAGMLSRRPFGSLEAARAAARAEWFALAPESWKDAFAHHPRIGDVDALRTRFSGAAPSSSAREQAGLESADSETLRALASANREYEARFGYIFIVCASGRSADQMAALLRARMSNSPETEILIAAEEHARICDLRLAAVV